MDKSTITLLLGVTFGLAVVGVVAVFVMLAKGSSPTLVMAQPALVYNNKEEWDVVKDENGRVKTIVVHREAMQK